MSLLMDALKRAETSKQEAARALAGGETKTRKKADGDKQKKEERRKAKKGAAEK